MERKRKADSHSKKAVASTDREYNTALYLLRCYEIGLTDADMEHLTYGMVLDMFTEKANDGAEYNTIATQKDFDKF